MARYVRTFLFLPRGSGTCNLELITIAILNLFLHICSDVCFYSLCSPPQLKFLTSNDLRGENLKSTRYSSTSHKNKFAPPAPAPYARSMLRHSLPCNLYYDYVAGLVNSDELLRRAGTCSGQLQPKSASSRTLKRLQNSTYCNRSNTVGNPSVLASTKNRNLVAAFCYSHHHKRC